MLPINLVHNQLWYPVPSRFQVQTVFPFSFFLFLLKADSQWDITKAGCSEQLYPLRQCLLLPEVAQGRGKAWGCPWQQLPGFLLLAEVPAAVPVRVPSSLQ